MNNSPDPRFVLLDPRDNVVVAVDEIPMGVAVAGVTARISRGHKMAIKPIGLGDSILKFGQIIGFAT